MDIAALKFAEAPGPARGRGGWQRRSLRPLALPSSYAVHQTMSLGPCKDYSQRSGRPNRWGVVERRLPVKTQGRTFDCTFNSAGVLEARWGRHHARCSCESRDSCFTIREKYSRVKATDSREVLAGQSDGPVRSTHGSKGRTREKYSRVKASDGGARAKGNPLGADPKYGGHEG